MKILIPMAGRGTRLRPHTLTVPKPLIPVAGKPIIQRLVESLSASYEGQIEEIAYIVGDFGADVERELVNIAEKLGARGRIYRQEKALGVGHAIHCAADSLQGHCMIAFADTLFKADFRFDVQEEGMIWVQKVSDPSSFGVVKLDRGGYITEFAEKPATYVSDLAIVGIYYFREAERLRAALQHIIQHNQREKNEFQLTTALERLKNEGVKFKTGHIEEWLDCGNKEAILYSNERMLEFHRDKGLISPQAQIENSVIIPPCYIGAQAVIRNSIVGPYVSVGDQSVVETTIVTNSILQNRAHIKNGLLDSCMLGNASSFSGAKYEVNLGDYSKFSMR